jgi:predicted  nucleic acid-binding Zn-ribbon protein
MGGNSTNTQEKLDATVKSLVETAKSKKGKIVGIIVLVIILLNTFWNMVESKITTELQAVKADLAELNNRLTEAEKGTLDVETVKADVDTIRKAGADFESKLNAVVKAEEEKLEILTKSAEDQKAYLESLKSRLAGETGQ